MIRIKICGITNKEDAWVAAEAGADALGFIFVPNTPRYIGDRSDLEDLLENLPPFVTRVGVCRNLSDASRLRGVPLDAIQLYEPPRMEERALLSVVLQGRGLILACRMRSVEDALEIGSRLEGLAISGVLFDAYDEKRLGGGGVVFDWNLACLAKSRVSVPVILAGGLTPENVEAAIRQVGPWGVDVSSGVEIAPGKKDPQKVRQFVVNARRADICKASG
ncbi:phosphoribosylanthranilate isomerase [Chthonomonas calidirosea]|uniref:phosphoribosylanthranilate isomerase n=1 Tax=Chthonomonas calidirosea TaxID=454171 RepID=UPI0006DD4CB6|nr:phosphoribosylanthranilate isomerase [Chthonomonas calidirosea]CEK13694.1 phosphoribosylanthranilate isomerase [Chthonomonas calidirosea]